MDLPLTGKIALITGAGARLGRSFALALAKEGCDIAVHYHQNSAGAAETAEAITALGRRVLQVGADLRESDAPDVVARAVLGEFTAVDLLINNASRWSSPESIRADQGLLSETVSEWDQNFAVNARAPFFLMQRFAAALRKRQGAIVNIVDRSASEPFLSRSSHSLSKTTLLAASRLAARTLAPEVRVNALELDAILPPAGMSETEMKRRAWKGPQSAVDALLFVVKNQSVNGEIISVAESSHLRRPL